MAQGGWAATGYGQHPAQLSNLPPGSVADAIVSSPPYADGCAHTGGADPQPQHIQGGPLPHVAYGQEDAQLGNLPPGDVQAVISSPPYADQQVGTGKEGRTGWRGYTDFGGGTSAQPGQLAALPTGEVAGRLSPPWMEEANTKKPSASRVKLEAAASPGAMDATYGATPGQLGTTGDLSCNPTCAVCGGRKRGAKLCQCPTPEWRFRGEEPGTTFWSAAKTILEQTSRRPAPRWPWPFGW